MVPIIPELRKILENRIPEARQASEEAARAVLDTLAVTRPEPFPSMTPEQRRLRNALRARARQLGNGGQAAGFEPLVEEAAYFQWHRMVFARFLAENNLLMHPSNVPVTLQDCAELAHEEGEVDGWAVAAKYASRMLPGIFRPEDPETQLRLAPEGQQKLEVILNAFPVQVFLADDSLGWMYQFWQSRKKDEINKSEKKIGGADIPPVTQLFTEDYMVRFLLENTLGAWWAAHHPDSPLLNQWEYLRYKEDGTPAAGIFPGWPERVAELTMLDPCCGSGHFLAAAFDMLSKMRIEEEGLNDQDAVDAVLRYNLFGLEIDPRCTQIAYFALTLIAWKKGGYHRLPLFNLVCTGLAVNGQLSEWVALAGHNAELRRTLSHLYQVFQDAPDLGSLIDPNRSSVGPLFSFDYLKLQAELEKTLYAHMEQDDQAKLIFGNVAENVLRASRFLSCKYNLIATNVPYLGRGKQGPIIIGFCDAFYPHSKSDLSTVFVERCLRFCEKGGLVAVLTPQNWLFLQSYLPFRKQMLEEVIWKMVISFGPGAFQTISGEVVKSIVLIIENDHPYLLNNISMLDLSDIKHICDKISGLKSSDIISVPQHEQRKNNKSIISFGVLTRGAKLSDYVEVCVGSQPGQTTRLTRFFWEIPKVDNKSWVFMESSPDNKGFFTGKNKICMSIDIINKLGVTEHVIRGKKAWGKKGVIISRMNNLPSSLYCGEFFDDNTYVLIPKKLENLPAIYNYVSSNEYLQEVRKINKKLGVTTEAVTDVPFDLNRWIKIAEQHLSIPKPFSNDPDQWIFDGNPITSLNPLHVTVARLLGYSWPKQNHDLLEQFTDEDGILCLPSVFSESSAVERLRTFLTAAFGNGWSPTKQVELLSQVGSPGKSLEDWLHEDFFAQHCKLFQNRPFIWHIWDGRKDGFSALVNYHKLSTANLDRLIYTYLGDWINFQRARRDHGEPGADGRLVAAIQLQEKLKLIREGQAPYDIYVRWKSFAEQPIGWDPDLNDGVRVNIRPFVLAGVLRSKFTINWNKDRGKNPDGSERLNDLHYTIAEKVEARRNAGK